MTSIKNFAGVEHLTYAPCGDHGVWLWRGRMFSYGPRPYPDPNNPAVLADVERLTVPRIEAEAAGWVVTHPTPGRRWASNYSRSWPHRPPMPKVPTIEDYRRAGREQKLDWIYQFLVTSDIPEKQWDKLIKKVWRLCR